MSFIPNGKYDYYPAKDLQQMSLTEIRQKYIRTCGKANGEVSVCSKCKTPCREGKRAIQLLANEVFAEKVPLYDGKTLLEKAREANRRRLAGEKKMSLSEVLALEPQKKKRKYTLWNGWWEESLASENQIQWLVDNMNISVAQAKKKVYAYKYTHGLTKQNSQDSVSVKTNEPVKPVDHNEDVEKETDGTSQLDANIEAKLDKLMRLQETYKREAEEYLRKHNEAMEKYKALKEKTDILCTAMDIINE